MHSNNYVEQMYEYINKISSLLIFLIKGYRDYIFFINLGGYIRLDAWGKGIIIYVLNILFPYLGFFLLWLISNDLGVNPSNILVPD